MNISSLSHEFLFFSGFLLFIFLMLAIDLGVFSKKNQEISFKQAAIMSSIWVFFALIFFVILYIWGNELHNIQDFDKLAEITQRHMHKIQLIPGNFDANLQIYNHNLALK